MLLARNITDVAAAASAPADDDAGGAASRKGAVPDEPSPASLLSPAPFATQAAAPATPPRNLGVMDGLFAHCHGPRLPTARDAVGCAVALGP